MNNSLEPIKSLAASLESILRRDPPPRIGGRRAVENSNCIPPNSLGRFLQGIRDSETSAAEKRDVELPHRAAGVNVEPRLNGTSIQCYKD